MRLVLLALLAAIVPMEVGAQATTSDPPVSVYRVVVPDPSSVSGDSVAQEARPQAAELPPSQKRGEFVFAPMPMINPTLENGLFLMTGYLFRLDVQDRVTAPSVSAVGGFKTSNGSWGGLFMENLHLAHDQFRVRVAIVYTDLNYDFHGIGQESGASGLSIPLNQVGPQALVDAMVRVAPKWYVGARYQIFRMKVSTEEVSVPDGPTLPAADANLRTAALGPRAEFDGRDNPFYPRGGVHLQGTASFYDEALGGRRTYQAYQASLESYYAMGSRHVLAWHAGACRVAGSAPFYDLCQLGKNRDLRGYPVGQYRDRAMLAAQAEWRTELWWRFGAVAFAGIGQIAPEFSKFTWRDTLPGSGIGLRFTLAKRSHLNLRVDYAWGKESTALYVGVAEAF